MSDVSKEMQEILELQQKAEEMRKGANSVVEEANERVAKLQKRVKAGATTGDKIKDFVLARYGFLSEEIENTYRDIQERVAKSVGEFVFIFYARDRQAGCTGFGGRGYFTRDRGLYVGIIRDEGLILHKPEKGCAFKTESYAFLVRRQNGEVSHTTENLSENIRWNPLDKQLDFGLELTKPSKGFNLTMGLLTRREENPPELVLKIGDNEINQWLVANPMHISAFQEMAKRLNRYEKFFDKYPHLR